MEIVTIKTKSVQDGKHRLVLNFNQNAYRYLYAVLNNKLYKNNGIKCTPSTDLHIRRCLLMYALTYIYCRYEKAIIRNGLFSPISKTDGTLKSIREQLEQCYLVFTEKHTFVKQTYPETVFNTDIIYEVCPWYSALVKVESFSDTGDYVELECFYDEDPDNYVIDLTD